ncbi:hypothetical protein GUJ93_ZPchr0003g18404 [Zizania palustris]|uniref:Secreted protein n=1 Tax=Zizania palustris TaxID=103762 RepID=A0A8J5VX64_ZIZPA|nr:hypothetical protein GUJ93_ZPchr0003g18404 [Zizania palustris]
MMKVKLIFIDFLLWPTEVTVYDFPRVHIEEPRFPCFPHIARSHRPPALPRVRHQVARATAPPAPPPTVIVRLPPAQWLCTLVVVERAIDGETIFLNVLYVVQ